MGARDGDLELGPEPEERARQLFADALLRERFEPGAERVERSLERALERIRSEADTRVPGRPRRLSLPLAAGAAAGLLLLLFALLPGTATAGELVDRALASARIEADRRYAVEIERGAGSGPSRLELDVRGGRSFLVRIDSGLLGGFRAGWDGERVWVVPARSLLPVLVGHAPAALHEWLESRGEGLPFLQLTAVLEQLARDYDVR